MKTFVIVMALYIGFGMSVLFLFDITNAHLLFFLGALTGQLIQNVMEREKRLL